jgi:Mrp family chromosome partitioning ATPase
MSRMLDALRQIDGRSLSAGPSEAPAAPEVELQLDAAEPEATVPLATPAPDPPKSRAREQRPTTPEPPIAPPAPRPVATVPPTQAVKVVEPEVDDSLGLELPPVQPIRVRSVVLDAGQALQPDGNRVSAKLENPGRGPDPIRASVRPANLTFESSPSTCPASDCSIAVGRLLRTFPPGRPGVLLFASPEPDGGATAVVAALGAELAPRVTGEILAVDGNLRFPALTEHLMAESYSAGGLGLIDVLNGSVEWGAAVCLTEIGHLDLLAGRRPTHGESCGGDPRRWEVMLEELRRAYQLVLVDASPAGDPAVQTVARYADGVYLVVDLGHTGRRAARQAVATLRQAGGRVLGSVIADSG